MNRFDVQLLVCAFLAVPAVASVEPLLAQADNYGPDKTVRKQEAANQMHFVLVMKSHFDIGYSARTRRTFR